MVSCLGYQVNKKGGVELIYYFKSPVGTFKITPKAGRYLLEINGDICGTYPSAVAAADDVFTQSTGCYEWDELDSPYAPSDITEWECF